MLRDLHVHTNFSDGADSPEQVVLAAIGMGITTLGFSDHSATFFDKTWCMTEERYPVYRAEIARLREKYAGKIGILCGIEQDYYSSLPAEGFDYVIGSVHALRCGEDYLDVDNSLRVLQRSVRRYFKGDALAFAELYYETVGKLADCPIDIVGHFDLLTKFQEQKPIFDTASPRYVSAWQSAADKLLKAGKSFEINTGAISRGLRTTPYPAPDILSYLKEHGAKLILSSDSHRADTLCYAFDRFGGLLE